MHGDRKVSALGEQGVNFINPYSRTNKDIAASGRNDMNDIADFFWDVDVKSLDIVKNKRFIIERLLQFGRPEQIQWMLARYSDGEIIEVVKSSKTIDKKTANYWALHYHILPKEVLCLNRQLMQECFY